jgi:hypothetical protein
MKKQDYTSTIVVNSTAKEAFKCISRVSGWWTENVAGNSENLNDIFTVNFGETFVDFKVIEVIPVKKMVWLVTDCNLHWLSDKKEWKGTKVIFEISSENSATEIKFTHLGLLPDIQCYNDCVKGWGQYVKDSLYKLITEGKGRPERKIPETANASH